MSMDDKMRPEIPARTEYGTELLDREHLTEEPMELFDRWFNAAVAAGVPEPNGFCLCTGDPEVGGDGRILLMKGYGSSGFTFFTNFESTKSGQLAHEPRASMVFWWQALRRQVRVQGRVEKVSDQESDAYFASRPRSSQLGAWASQQSRPVESRQDLLDRYGEFEARFPEEVSRPPHWGGYLLVPQRIEFWQGRDSRLHDRFVFLKGSEGDWRAQRLMP